MTGGSDGYLDMGRDRLFDELLRPEGDDAADGTIGQVQPADRPAALGSDGVVRPTRTRITTISG